MPVAAGYLHAGVATMQTRVPHTQAPDAQDAAYWLAQATADYERLSSSLSALATELAALKASIQGPIGSASTGSFVYAQPLPYDAEYNVRVNLFGPFQLQIGDRKLPADVPGQVRTILKYLISNRKHLTRKDVIMDLFWPDANPAVVSSRLRVLMHVLRKSVPSRQIGLREFIVTNDSNFAVNPEARLWVDVEEFEEHWQRGWRLARAGHTAEALAEYEQAEALYRGDYLEDELYADWTLLRREGLRDAHATILTMLATMSLKDGDYPGAIIWAQKLLAQDNCREDVYRILMQSHHELGQHSRARHWYDLCARTLKTEIGIEPSARTRSLLQEIEAR